MTLVIMIVILFAGSIFIGLASAWIWKERPLNYSTKGIKDDMPTL